LVVEDAQQHRACIAAAARLIEACQEWFRE
jgi:hypothetical protein